MSMLTFIEAGAMLEAHASTDVETNEEPAVNAPATTELPVVVIGAGPAGLAAAAHLVDRGIEPLVLEAGPTAGAAVREWAHVRLFSTWGEVVDPAAEKLLAPTGWVKPDPDTYPSGGDWAEF